MKIRFLGTSAGWPLPRLGCKCEICTSKDPKDTRTRTQLLVNDEIILDAGPDTYSHLKTIVATKIKAIFISHAHLDHIQGFWDLTHIYNGYKPISVYVTQPVLSEVRKFISLHGQNLKINVVEPLQTIDIANLKITYIPVIHGKTPANAIKVKGNKQSFSKNKIFTYITDFNKILPSSQKLIRYSDFLALDGSTLGKVGQGPGHISITDGISIAKNLKPKGVYFVHIGHKTGAHEALEKYLLENAGPNFHIAYDNQEITI